MKKKTKDEPKNLKKGLVDIEKLKEFGVTKDPAGNDIEEIDGESITGGKNEGNAPTVGTHWPTSV